MENRAGTFISNLSGEMAYKSFRPSPLQPTPPVDIDPDMLAKLIHFPTVTMDMPRYLVEKPPNVYARDYRIFSNT